MKEYLLDQKLKFGTRNSRLRFQGNKILKDTIHNSIIFEVLWLKFTGCRVTID